MQKKRPVASVTKNKAANVAVTKAKEPSPASYAAVAKNSSSTDWAKVKPKRMRIKPEALILKKTSQVLYADMLRKMRADPNLSELGKHVKKIRRTQQGELLLEIEGKASGNVSLYRETNEESLKEMAAVRTGMQRVALNCSRLD